MSEFSLSFPAALARFRLTTAVKKWHRFMPNLMRAVKPSFS